MELQAEARRLLEDGLVTIRRCANTARFDGGFVDTAAMTEIHGLADDLLALPHVVAGKPGWYRWASPDFARIRRRIDSMRHASLLARSVPKSNASRRDPIVRVLSASTDSWWRDLIAQTFATAVILGLFLLSFVTITSPLRYDYQTIYKSSAETWVTGLDQFVHSNPWAWPVGAVLPLIVLSMITAFLGKLPERPRGRIRQAGNRG